MSFEAWLRQSLKQHPLKEAPSDTEEFTAGVMARVRQEPQPERAPAWRAYFSLPRFSFALAAAAAGLLVAVTLAHRGGPGQFAGDIAKRIDVLAAISNGEALFENGLAEMSDGEAQDLMVLAESDSASDDTGWIEQMSRLLDDLEEEAPASSGEGGDSWEDELEMLNDAEASVAS